MAEQTPVDVSRAEQRIMAPPDHAENYRPTKPGIPAYKVEVYPPFRNDSLHRLTVSQSKETYPDDIKYVLSAVTQLPLYVDKGEIVGIDLTEPVHVGRYFDTIYYILKYAPGIGNNLVLHQIECVKEADPKSVLHKYVSGVSYSKDTMTYVESSESIDTPEGQALFAQIADQPGVLKEFDWLATAEMYLKGEYTDEKGMVRPLTAEQIHSQPLLPLKK